VGEKRFLLSLFMSMALLWEWLLRPGCWGVGTLGWIPRVSHLLFLHRAIAGVRSGLFKAGFIMMIPSSRSGVNFTSLLYI
jgi:hypothetical protein